MEGGSHRAPRCNGGTSGFCKKQECQGNSLNRERVSYDICRRGRRLAARGNCSSDISGAPFSPREKPAHRATAAASRRKNQENPHTSWSSSLVVSHVNWVWSRYVLRNCCVVKMKMTAPSNDRHFSIFAATSERPVSISTHNVQSARLACRSTVFPSPIACSSAT